MPEWIWLNGDVMPLADARIGVEDRGFQFADGVYEVMRVYNGKLFALSEHLDRLDRSRTAIVIDLPIARETLAKEIAALVERSGFRDAKVYVQLTRGAGPRSHEFVATKPTLLFYAREIGPIARPGEVRGQKIVSVKDERWQRCWIKSIALLPNILAKNEAVSRGASEAVFIEKGVVTECSTSNIFMVIGGRLVTHPVGAKVLPGITRMVLIDIAKRLGIMVEERGVALDEALRAQEAFVTNTTHEAEWVREWDGKIIGDGTCGPVTMRLHEEYAKRVREMTD